MVKFIYFKSAVYECEVSVVSPKPYECRGEEQLYLVTSPCEFNGEKWYSQFFTDTVDESLKKAEEIIRFDAHHQLTKKGIPFTEEDIQENLKSVKVKGLNIVS